MEEIWIFNGNENLFPSATFTTRTLAEHWIRKYSLSGTLTRYPVNISVYDWVIEKDYFKPKKEYQSSPRFIQSFSSAYMEHYHYNSGEQPDE
jgi:hypothetical protein